MANTDSGVETECESSDNSLSMDSSRFAVSNSEGNIVVGQQVHNIDLTFFPPPGLFTNSKEVFLQDHIKHIFLHGNMQYSRDDHQNKIRSNNSRRDARRWWYIKNVVNLRSILDERKLRIASSLNNIEMVERLLKSKVNPKAADSSKRTALHIASSKGFTDIVKLLLDYGADPNQKDIVGNTSLHLAVCSNHINTVTVLLKAGTNVHSFDKYGRTPLHLAQSKLKLLQSDKSCNSEQLKSEVYRVIDMLQVYLKKSGQNMEADLVHAFASRLNLTQTKEEVDTNVRELLSNLSQLSLHKTDS